MLSQLCLSIRTALRKVPGDPVRTALRKVLSDLVRTALRKVLGDLVRTASGSVGTRAEGRYPTRFNLAFCVIRRVRV